MSPSTAPLSSNDEWNTVSPSSNSVNKQRGKDARDSLLRVSPRGVANCQGFIKG